MSQTRVTKHPLEQWLKNVINDKSSRTSSVQVKGNRVFVRISHYFEHYKDGLDARGEGNDLKEATKDAILHFNQLLWKQVVRRSKNTELNKLKDKEHDQILKEMRAVHLKEFKACEFLKEVEYRDKIYKNNDLLELSEREDVSIK